jgi:hypothetical protein
MILKKNPTKNAKNDSKPSKKDLPTALIYFFFTSS